MTVKKNVVGRKKFDVYNELPNGDGKLMFKEKGNPFDEKNQVNGSRKRDPNIVDVQSPTDVISEEAKEQFDTNTVDVQKYDAPNDDDDNKLPCNDKQLASQPSTQDVIDVLYAYASISKDVQSCEVVPNVKYEELDERMKLQMISKLVRSKINVLLRYAAKIMPTSSSFTNAQ